MPELIRVSCILAWLLLAIATAPAFAFQLPIETTVSVRFGAIPPLVTQARVGVAEVGVAGGLLQSLRLASSLPTTGALVGPLPPTTWAPIGGLQGTFALDPSSYWEPLSTFVRAGDGSIGGAVPLRGFTRVCLFTPACPGASDPIILFNDVLGNPSAAGWQGTWTQQGAINFTVKGAPWTTRTVTAGNGVTGMGFAVGPASLPGSTVMNGGRLNLVTPIFVSTSIPSNRSNMSSGRS